MKHLTRAIFFGVLILVLLVSCSILPKTQNHETTLPTAISEQPMNLKFDGSSAEFSVGYLGGNVTIRDIQINIPQNSLHETTDISVQVLAEEQQLDELPLYTTFLGAISFGPDGLSFAQPIQVVMGLASSREPGTNLSVYSKNKDGTYEETGILAKVSDDGEHAEILLSHFSTYVVIDGVTGITLGENFLEEIGNGQTPETAYYALFEYLKSINLDIGNCLNGDRSIEGYMLDVTYKSRDVEYRNNALLGMETQIVNINSMQYSAREGDDQIFIDILLVIYLGDQCPIVYTGVDSYTDRGDVCTCSSCGGETITALVKIDDQGRISGQLIGVGIVFTGTRDSINGIMTNDPNNCQSVCTFHLEARLINNDQEFVGIVWDECTPGNCHFDECVGTWSFSLTRTEPDSESE